MKIPEQVLAQLALTDPNASEQTWCGLYNALLYTLFPIDENFLVVPLPESIDEDHTVELHTCLRVNHRQRRGTVFLMLIRERGALNNLYGRERASNAQRQGIFELLERIAIPKLFTVSMMGTRFAVQEFYTNSGRLNPGHIRHKDGAVLTDVAPAERWEYDILEPAGQKKFEEMVTEIKQMCESGGDAIHHEGDEESRTEDSE